MKDNKLYKVLRIIFLTLAILSLVFTLCKKVGLCASSDTITLPSAFDSLVPIPIGPGYGYNSQHLNIDSSWISNAISFLEGSSVSPNGKPVRMITIIENNYANSGYYEFWAWYGTTSSGNFSVSYSANDHKLSSSSSSTRVSFRYYPDSNTFSNNSTLSTQVWNIVLYGSNNLPFGSSQLADKYIFQRDVDFTKYPVYVADSILEPYFQWFEADSGSIYVEGEVTPLPSFDSLPGSVDSTDDQPTLFDKLKGWLSTLSGNIQKGFKNIEEG